MQMLGRCLPKLDVARFGRWTGLVAWLAVLSAVAATGADWPTYRHDIARSGVTDEAIKPPLAVDWMFQPRYGPQPAWDDPKPEPVEGILELRRMHFDDTFQVAVSAGKVFFGSSASNKVYCLDAATGKIRWSRIVGGPVRLAPTVWKDRILFGADDGYVWCLRADDGAVVWRFHAAPDDRRVLGHGKLISLWPVRTGVLVDQELAYFGAGIFPGEGVYLWAVRARDGSVVWCNSSAGQQPQSRISPQGYLLASSDRLYVPLGRASPATFDRRDGRLLNTAYFGKTVGGTYALLANHHVFTGTEELMGYREDSPGARFAWFGGRKLLVARNRFYMLTDREMSMLDQRIYAPASLRRKSLLAQRDRLQREITLGRRQSRDVSKLEQQLQQLKEQIASAEKTMASSIQWRVPCDAAESFILAGNVLVAGGDGHVIAVDEATGRRLWTGQVQGKAKGLAVADGRLLVSTDTGAIYCFVPQEEARGAVVKEEDEIQRAAASGELKLPAPDSRLTELCRTAARQIVRQTGIRRGYALVLGCQTAELAAELARQTELTVYVVDPDRQRVEAARRALDAAGLYGTRVCVDAAPLERVPYADYFANLIVSEDALLSGRLPPSATEIYRMLKPLGGTLVLGQPDQTPDNVPKLAAQKVQSWLAAAGLHGSSIEQGGSWVQLARGALPGAGSWTHQYAEPGNTACGDDQLVRAPLGVLWFGSPGPTNIVNRHRRAAAPLSVAGRLFVQGENVVMAYDAYNGLKLWQRKIPGAYRPNASHDGSNLAARADSLLVAVGDECLRLDAATGETLKRYPLPAASDGQPRRWGYIACVGDVLYGSRTRQGRTSDAVFALDIETGRQLWLFEGHSIPHNSIAIGDGRLFLADSRVTAEERRAAVWERLKVSERALAPSGDALQKADVRRIYALDAASGKTIWQHPVDLTNCIDNLSAMYHDGFLVLFGVYLDGHYWQQFFAGQFASRRINVLDTSDGHLLWSKAIGYRVRPLIVGQTLHAEPWAFDLRTGQRKMRTHPVTGVPQPWQLARPGHHCGCPSASPNLMLFRSYCIGYYDLVGDYGTLHFGAQRTGCWINFIPANGLVLIPEASAGCMCPFPNMCTVVMKPTAENKAWGMFSSPGPLQPVKHLAINFGAPGDRKDQRGVLWLGYPRPRGNLVLQMDLDVRLMSQAGYFEHAPEVMPVAGTKVPWIFTTGCRGLARCTVPLAAPEDGEALYDVRLYFADLDNDQPGRRVFDILVQGEVVRKDFDIAAEAGGRARAVVVPVEGVRAGEQLEVQLRSKLARPAPEQMPVLQGLEIVRRRVLGPGLAAAPFVLNDRQRTQRHKVQLANQTDELFAGRLLVEAPEGFTATPDAVPVRLPASGGKATIGLQLALAGRVAAGTYPVRLKLVKQDGTEVLSRSVPLEYLAGRGRVVLKAIEDAYVGKSFPTSNRGTTPTTLVDGGAEQMGDYSHHVTYLKFRWQVPGKPRLVTLRLYNAGNPSGDSGRICLVRQPWSERTITYNNRPKPGPELARIGAVAERQVVECTLELPATPQGELSLMIDPTSRDGVDYLTREGGKPAELVVEYDLPK